MGVSSFDQVSNHLQKYGEYRAMRLDQSDDLDLIVGRLESVRNMGAEYAEIELSPYMKVLLGVTRSAAKQESVVKQMVAVGS